MSTTNPADIAGSEEEAAAREAARRVAAENLQRLAREQEAHKAFLAKAAAEAKATHEKAHQEASDAFEALDHEVSGMMDDIEGALGRAKDDRAHLAHAASFIRDVGLKVAEIRAWIKRSA